MADAEIIASMEPGHMSLVFKVGSKMMEKHGECQFLSKLKEQLGMQQKGGAGKAGGKLEQAGGVLPKREQPVGRTVKSDQKTQSPDVKHEGDSPSSKGGTEAGAAPGASLSSEPADDAANGGTADAAATGGLETRRFLAS